MRIALELELADLKVQYERQEEALDKARNKTDKMRDVAANYEVGSKDNTTEIITNYCSQSEVKEQKAIVADAKRQITKLTKQVEKLKTDLETERARVRPPSPHVRTHPIPSSPH